MNSATSFLLRRSLWPRRGDLTGFGIWISVLGVALGIVLLVVVLSVMSGFQNLFKDNYTRITSELVVLPRTAHSEEKIRSLLGGIPEIEAFTPFAFGQGLVLKGGVGGVILEGIDLRDSERVVPWKQIWVSEPLWQKQKENPHWIWVGVQLAKKLNLELGESVNLLIVEGNKKRVVPFVITGLTKFGIYDHDLRYATIGMDTLKELFRGAADPPMYKTKLKGEKPLSVAAKEISSTLGDRAGVKTWEQVNQNIFKAVAHQKFLLFLVLELVIGLAAMNVVNLVLMTAQERRRDIAILRAMGWKLRSVFLFFLAQGSFISGIGIVAGVAGGLIFCALFERFQPTLLSESVYNVTRLPVQTNGSDLLLICIVALILCTLFSVIPALNAAKRRPVEALRYDD